MTRRTLRRLVLALPLFAFAPGCESDSFTGVCTLIGCDSGLTIELNEVPVGAYSVEVIPRNTPYPPVYRYDCVPGPVPCLSWILFKDYTGESSRVRVTTADGTIEHVVNVTYAERSPNGRRCGPTCRSARATVTIPVP